MSKTHAVLLSGLGGRLGSFGLYGIASKLNRLGVETNVQGWRYWPRAVEDMVKVKERDPDAKIVLIGYSQGSIRAIQASYQLAKRGVDVDLIVTLLPGGDWYAAYNVKRLVNLYIEGGWITNIIRPGPGFKGELENVDYSSDWSIWHVNFDKHPRIQSRVVEEVSRLL